MQLDAWIKIYILRRVLETLKVGLRRLLTIDFIKFFLIHNDKVTSSLPTFCFPDGGYIYRKPQEPQVNYLVLTNMEGCRTYAVCVTFFCPFSVIESTVEQGQFVLMDDTGVPEDTFEAIVRTAYVPICVCLVSSFPYLDTLKVGFLIVIDLSQINKMHS